MLHLILQQFGMSEKDVKLVMEETPKILESLRRFGEEAPKMLAANQGAIEALAAQVEIVRRDQGAILDALKIPTSEAARAVESAARKTS